MTPVSATTITNHKQLGTASAPHGDLNLRVHSMFAMCLRHATELQPPRSSPAQPLPIGFSRCWQGYPGGLSARSVAALTSQTFPPHAMVVGERLRYRRRASARPFAETCPFFFFWLSVLVVVFFFCFFLRMVFVGFFFFLFFLVLFFFCFF